MPPLPKRNADNVKSHGRRHGSTQGWSGLFWRDEGRVQSLGGPAANWPQRGQVLSTGRNQNWTGTPATTHKWPHNMEPTLNPGTRPDINQPIQRVNGQLSLSQHGAMATDGPSSEQTRLFGQKSGFPPTLAPHMDSPFVCLLACKSSTWDRLSLTMAHCVDADRRSINDIACRAAIATSH
jgi:hypothetical protein